MKHAQFFVGVEFWCGGRRWRCTDIGSRTIIAISLEPHEVESVKMAKGAALPADEQRNLTNDPSWLNGPPYAVDETVFDEYDLEGCSLARVNE
jgi:hypothetical protein